MSLAAETYQSQGGHIFYQVYHTIWIHDEIMVRSPLFPTIGTKGKIS